MATQQWIDSFLNYRLCDSVVDRSDHKPILLYLHGQQRRRRGRQFRFKNSWSEEESLEVVVEKGWVLGDSLDVSNRLKACTKEMNVWGKPLRMIFLGDIDRCRKDLEVLREEESTELPIGTERCSRSLVDYLLKRSLFGSSGPKFCGSE